MRRRTVIAAGFGSLSTVGLSGCLLWNTSSRPSSIRFEATPVTESEICERPIRSLDELEEDEEHVREAIRSGRATTDYTLSDSLYVDNGTSYFYIEIHENDTAHTFLVENTSETFDTFCGVVLDNLVLNLDRLELSQSVRTTIRETIDDGAVESSPPNDAAKETVDFFREHDYNDGDYDSFIRLDGTYYDFDFNYRTGE